jgi:hypothetical protein
VPGYLIKKMAGNICKGCHQKELPGSCYVIDRLEDITQEGQEEDGFIFEDGTG